MTHEHTHENDASTSNRQAAGVILRSGTYPTAAVLMMRRSSAETSHVGLWELPGGKVEAGETPLSTAQTELMEETGFAADSWEYIDTHTDERARKDYHIFNAVLPDDVPLHEVAMSDEHDMWCWIHPTDVMSMAKAQLWTVSHHALYVFKQMTLASSGA